MKKKSEMPPKEVVAIRLKQKTIKKVDEIRINKEESRGEFLRKIIENVIENY